VASHASSIIAREEEPEWIDWGVGSLVVVIAGIKKLREKADENRK
jgi:hypothetical protein